MTVETWVVLIDQPPAEPDSREMLELVLAGASLELKLVVVFTGRGSEHLQGQAAAPWRQLIDFELAPIWYECSAGETMIPALPAKAASVEQIERLCVNACGVLAL